MFIVLVFISCKDENLKPEKRVYMIKSHIEHEENGISVGMQSTDTIFFSKGFWKVFMNKFQITSSKIFKSNYPYQWGTITIGDTTLETKVLDSSKILSLRTHLPNHISGKELIDSNYLDKLILNDKFKNDTNLLSNGKLKYKIRGDYSRLIELLNDTTVNQIEIFSTKEFLNSEFFKN